MRAATPERLTIGRLARVGGVNLETIRYYEREGLLPRPPRTRAGYRIFPTDAARRLRFIKRAQDLGFSLKEIRELLALRVKPGTKADQIRARTEAKIADIDEKIQTLSAMKRTLADLTTRCSGCSPMGECPILESLDHETEADHG
jgi:MerR family mercuric resistance operon transcriptional regulator